MVVFEGSWMSFVEDLDQFLVGRIAFPAVNYVLNRKGILGRYRELLATERSSKEALRELQFQKLAAALRHAYESCPFYTKRFKEIGLVPDDIKTLEDFRRIPPLDRKDVIAHRLDLVDARYRESALAADRAAPMPGLPIRWARFRGHKLVRNTSTGSTGTPTIFYEDGSTTALNWVHEQRLKSWYGLAPGVKEARMKGISTQYGKTGVLSSIREHLWNQLMLPAYFLSDVEYELCIRKIREFRPRVLWGPTTALTGLAEYVQHTNQDFGQRRPDLVISWAAPLYDHQKKILGEVFGSPVTNLYGTREVGHVAMNCPHGSTHVNQENYLVEIEGADSDQKGAGPGNILITPLNESPMPFLRYRIGDLAELGEDDCPCGRSLLGLKRILGRVGDVLKTNDGHLIEPNFWCQAFMSGRPSRDVERFQVVYRRNDCIRFRIVPRREYSAETEAKLRRFIEENLATRVQLEFEYVSEIKPQASGKFPVVVNEIEQHEEVPASVPDHTETLLHSN
jgi:phenylacetate-CoA ligase